MFKLCWITVKCNDPFFCPHEPFFLTYRVHFCVNFSLANVAVVTMFIRVPLPLNHFLPVSKSKSVCFPVSTVTYISNANDIIYPPPPSELSLLTATFMSGCSSEESDCKIFIFSSACLSELFAWTCDHSCY